MQLISVNRELLESLNFSRETNDYINDDGYCPKMAFLIASGLITERQIERAAGAELSKIVGNVFMQEDELIASENPLLSPFGSLHRDYPELAEILYYEEEIGEDNPFWRKERLIEALEKCKEVVLV